MISRRELIGVSAGLLAFEIRRRLVAAGEGKKGNGFYRMPFGYGMFEWRSSSAGGECGRRSVAVALAEAVTYPGAGNIGGGGFMLFNGQQVKPL